MKYLFRHWRDVCRALRNGKQRHFLFDFDGTLVPIAKTPYEVTLPENTRELLFRLSKGKKCRVGIISGRPLKQVRRLAGIKGLLYAGNHGSEILENSRLIIHPEARRTSSQVRDLFSRLRGEFSGVRGLLLENKKYSISIHYRLMAAGRWPALRKRLLRFIGPFLKPSGLALHRGKKILEIRPDGAWNKGKAVDYLMKASRRGGIPFYIGDDDTDEDAFSALNSYGITVRVGRKKNSMAEYYVKSQTQTKRVLEKLLHLDEKKGS